MEYFGCNGRMATNLPCAVPFPFKHSLFFRLRDAEILTFPWKGLFAIVAKVCHQAVIRLAAARSKLWIIFCFGDFIFRSVLFERVIGHQSENSGVNIALGGARPSVPVSIQPWSFTRAL